MLVMDTSNEAVNLAAPDGEVVEVVPEPIDTDASRPGCSQHPPPPPSLRARAAAHEVRSMSVDEDEPELACDLMTRELLTIGPDDPLERLQAHMQSFQIRHLPVVEGNRLVGLIAHSDLLRTSSSMLSKSAPEENAVLDKLPASRIMTRDPIAVRPDEPLANVAALIWQSRLGCVPVTDEQGTLLGIITEGDFVRLGYHFLTRRRSVLPIARHGDAESHASAS